MAERAPHKLKIKLPTGAELEAEGSPEFVASERKEFMLLLSAPVGGGGSQAAAGAPGRPGMAAQPAWGTILETRGHNLQLRAKLRGDRAEKEACLVLLAASKVLLRNPKPTASQLARWLRASGYPISRVDRAIQSSIDRGEILASGSRRARRYELSGPGTAKAFGLAFEHSAFIQPAPETSPVAL